VQRVNAMIEQSGTGTPIEIFATCPQSKDFPREDYLPRVAEVACWSEAAGCTGILVYTDNSIVDPWLVAQIIIERTERLCPLVAVQPVYMHPYSAAKMVASYGYLHRRRIYLNMVAGGFRNDLEALNDPTPHDERYARVTEYTLVMKRLLESPDPVTFEGQYYTIRSLRMTPRLPPDLMPGILISGSSSAGIAAAQDIGATGIVYPKPVEEEIDASETLTRRGARIGIIARQDSADAWRIAHDRFPDDHKGRLTHKFATAVSDTVWHKQLSERIDESVARATPYWLWPFQTYKTFCPYLVGSYDETAEHVARYLAKGYRTFILDWPRSDEDLACARVVFHRAAEGLHA
jgi:alkanesulfonate monooxygenase